MSQIGRFRALTLAAALGALSTGLARAQSALDDSGDLPIRGTNAGMAENATLNASDTTNPLNLVQGSGAATDNPINYGRPKPRKKWLQRAYEIPPPHALPALVPYATAPGTNNRDPYAPTLQATPTTASIPGIRKKKRPQVDPHPFDPTGLRLRSFILTPYVESDLGYESNPLQIAKPGHGSWLLRETAGAKLQSDWSRHELDATLSGGYSDYMQTRAASAPDGSLVVNGRADATRDLSFDAQGRFVVGSQLTSTPGLLTGVNLSSRPLTYQTGGTLGATQKLGRITLALHGTLDRYTYQNASAANGSLIALSGQNYNDMGLRGRASYEITPGISPYIEVGGDSLRLDQPLDASGVNRNSSGTLARIGSTFELSRLLTGDVAVGVAHRNFTDPRISGSSSPTLDASLIWAASPLTAVTFKAASSVASTSVIGASTAQQQTASLQVDHQLMPNLLISGVGTWQNTNYRGANLVTNLYSAGVKADYNLTRSVVVRGSFTHQRLQSTAAGTNYTDNIMLLGLRLQR
ncbi:MAG: outer membrane beta-barrel protein [Hyphomicrobiales bacterium]|nr:outer membrane beta-barrel protein [Hyphomicrobiales bacterium]MDE2113916.1 outer membrane beta-barrel protein [Hyphomicrobiales bacterium]